LAAMTTRVPTKAARKPAVAAADADAAAAASD
jgi:hypothetical protein